MGKGGGGGEESFEYYVRSIMGDQANSIVTQPKASNTQADP